MRALTMTGTVAPILVLALTACGGEAERELEDDPVLQGAEVTVVDAAEGPDGLLPPATGPDAWIVDRGASSVLFTGRQNDDAFTGRFGEFDAAISLDPADVSDAQITAAIDLGSVDAGTNDRNASLPEADWFDIARHPRATFRSYEVRSVGDALYEADGTLTIKGAEQRVTMPFTLEVVGDRAVADGTLDLDRSAFGVGQGDFASAEWVGMEVGVAVHIEAVRTAGAGR